MDVGSKHASTVEPVNLSFIIIRIASAKSQSARGASQPALMGSCLTIGHTCLPHLTSRWVESLCSMIPYDWTDGGSVDFFFFHGMVLLLWVDAVLRNGYEIWRQNYVVSLQGSEMTAGYHYRSLTLCKLCFKWINFNVYQWPNGQQVRFQVQWSGIVSQERRIWICFSMVLRVLMKNKSLGNRKRFYCEMWGNAV